MPKSSKGSAFEREICKQLSLWWSKGTNPNIFWRTANSGGRMTTLAKKGKTTTFHHGDICAIDPIGQPLLDFVSIELKRGYAGVSVHDLLDKPNTGGVYPQFQQWIDQAERAKQNSGSYGWVLITKRDRKIPLVFMPGEIYYSTNDFRTKATFGMPTDTLMCVSFQDFVDVDPDVIRSFVSELKAGEM